MADPTSANPERAADRRGSAGDRGWWAVGLGVAAVGWGANQFAPLLLLYQAELGVAATTLQLTYATYAVGLIPALLLGGPASDRFGRRRLLLPALVLSALASLLLIAGNHALVLLYAGRLVAGLASGAAFGAGAAWIKELSEHASDGRNPGARRSTIAMAAGFSGGPLVAGLLAQWAPAPTVTAYVPHLALTILAIPLVAATPETARREPAVPAPVRPSRMPSRLSARDRRAFWWVVMPVGPWVFVTTAIAVAYLPGQVRGQLGGGVLLFGAIVGSLTLGAGIAVQPLARWIDRPGRDGRPGRGRLLVSALGVAIVGFVVAAGAVATGRPELVVVAALLLGAGYGGCNVYGLLEVQRLAPAGRLGRLTAYFQSATYVGFAAPFLLAAFERALPVPWLLLLVGGLAALTLAWAGAVSRRT